MIVILLTTASVYNVPAMKHRSKGSNLLFSDAHCRIKKASG